MYPGRMGISKMATIDVATYLPCGAYKTGKNNNRMHENRAHEASNLWGNRKISLRPSHHHFSKNPPATPPPSKQPKNPLINAKKPHLMHPPPQDSAMYQKNPILTNTCLPISQNPPPKTPVTYPKKTSPSPPQKTKICAAFLPKKNTQIVLKKTHYDHTPTRPPKCLGPPKHTSDHSPTLTELENKAQHLNV